LRRVSRLTIFPQGMPLDEAQRLPDPRVVPVGRRTEMAFIEWSDELSVGIEEFDEEHKVLVALFNDMHQTVQKGSRQEELRRILEGLAQYAEEHFAHEEREMEAAGFAGLEQHRQAHGEFRRRVGDLLSSLGDGHSSVLGVRVMMLLRGWLVDHIQKMDKEYGPVLSEHASKV